MNREIKFRAYSKKVKKMFYNIQETYDGLSEEKSGIDEDFVYRINCTSCFVDWLKNEEMEIMQFTGLLDKNGKEIYEGDILKDDVGDIFEVKFGELPLSKSGDCVCSYQAFYGKCYGQLGVSPMYDCQEIREWMEVIGNIYENPDLIK